MNIVKALKPVALFKSMILLLQYSCASCSRVSVNKSCVCVCVLLIALFVSVDRRITLKSLKAALEPHIGTSVDNFKVLCHFVF